MTAARLYLEGPLRTTARGFLYAVRLGSPAGRIIIEATGEPFLAGCRWLKANGQTGKAELWDSTRPFPRMTGDIERAARLTVKEGDTVSPKFAKWMPFLRNTYCPETANSDRGATPAPEAEASL